jgi:4-diphosphocytidyl-2-C-methyl-D-erythritol kinase
VNGPLTVAAPAKLNLFLHVGDKRGDGYHDLESLVAFAACGDEIALESHDDLFLTVDGPFGVGVPTGEDNLALKAAKLFAERTGAAGGARISLRKNLPVASGLGGGSADAAAVLRGLTRLWQRELNRNELCRMAASLGADVAVCLDSVTAWMEGRGECVRALPPLPRTGVLLVNPGVPVPTAQVFAALGVRRGLNLRAPKSGFEDVHTLVRYLRETTNDLEAPAKTVAPLVGELLQVMNALPDVLLARMSGSGATCFGLFANEYVASAAARLLRTRHPQWWIVESTFTDGS